jgi:hypothetical protein
MKAGKLESMLNRFPFFFFGYCAQLTVYSSSVTAIGNRGPGTEGQDARAGDQWTVLEMWLSARVGVGSRKNVNTTKPTTFQGSLTRPVVK